MKENKGSEVEDLVQKICARMFIADFVVRSPKFKKPSGQEKEAADILIPFKQNLLVYQVKSKSELKMASEKSDVDYKRIVGKIDEGIGQLNTIQSAINQRSIKNVQNSLGIVIPFDSEKFTKIIGIVVLDLLGEQDFPEEERTKIHNGFVFKDNMPIHIFLKEDLEIIATEIDTFPDFLKYLTKRETCFKKKILLHHTEERDFLALYKCYPKTIDEALSSKKQILLNIDSMWSNYQNNRKVIDERNNQNKPSFLIDAIIKYLNESIGFKPDFSAIVPRNDIEQGTVENYLISATELASIDRLTRRTIGLKFIELMVKANSSSNPMLSISRDKDDNSAILFLAAKLPREDRVIALQIYAALAYCKFNLRKIFCISSENESAEKRSYDCMLIEDVVYENHDELAMKAANLFNHSSHFRISEFGTDNKKTRKSNESKLGRNSSCPCGSGKKYKKCCLR